MSPTDLDWRAIGGMSGDALKVSVFEVLQIAAQALQEGEPDDPGILGIVPRLAGLIEERTELESFREAYNSLARAVGLWNYIDRRYADVRDEIVAEAATVAGLGVTLHREQVSALSSLLQGNNLILSAPTSFGKSLLIDALLLTDRFKRVAIVLPTIALLDEFRRRLMRRFGRTFSILMHHSEVADHDRVIFLGTQERLISRGDLGFLDLVVVDEFYKLDPSRQDDRSVTLNAAVYRLLRSSRQFFFLGPNIDNVTVTADSRWRFQFLRTRFSTVAVDTFDLAGVKDKVARLKEEAFRSGNWPALIFVSSPDRANRIANEITSDGSTIGTGGALANWISHNYGSRWPIIASIEKGVAVHHGRVPRALASRFISMFNSMSLPILICTSTMIEGVNTSAKSVMIYDKKISRSDYDFFTFSNIKGRAGRLGEHHIGNVYLFHVPPESDTVGVTAPLFGDLEDAPDEFVVHVEDEDTTPEISTRVEEMATRLGLSMAEVRRFSGLGIETLVELKSLIEGRLRSGRAIVWARIPTYQNIEAVCELICHVRRPAEFGAYTHKQLALYLNKLRHSNTLKEFFLWHDGSFSGAASDYDNVFKFLRASEYSLPEFFSATDAMLRQMKHDSNYELFIGQMVSWFRAPVLKMLEEQGVPIQISERFLSSGDGVNSLSERLLLLAQADDPRLLPVEKAWILDALPPPGTEVPS